MVFECPKLLHFCNIEQIFFQHLKKITAFPSHAVGHDRLRFGNAHAKKMFFLLGIPLTLIYRSLPCGRAR